jgi:hypothetical protein
VRAVTVGVTGKRKQVTEVFAEVEGSPSVTPEGPREVLDSGSQSVGEAVHRHHERQLPRSSLGPQAGHPVALETMCRLGPDARVSGETAPVVAPGADDRQEEVADVRRSLPGVVVPVEPSEH